MNNEEKNLTPENEGAEENKPVASAEQAGGKKLSGGMLAAIIGGVVVIIAVILLIVLLPGAGNDNGGNGDDAGSNVGGDTETKVTYTVTVVDQDGNPVKGALIYFTPKSGTAFPLPTEPDGKVSYTTDKEMKGVSVFSVPAGYEYGNLNQNQTFDNDGKITITVTKLAESDEKLVILVVDDEGNPISDVPVQMCDKAGLCKPGGVTDAEGKYYYAFAEGDFRAQITGGAVPAGYTVADPLAYYDFVDGVATIVLTKTN